MTVPAVTGLVTVTATVAPDSLVPVITCELEVVGVVTESIATVVLVSVMKVLFVAV